MPEPVDDKLYEQIKKEVYKQIPKHSAYRSGILVQKYKEKFKKKYGNKSPYIGKKTDTKGIARWFKEEWVNQRGEVGYKNKNDIYRPSKRITKDTPITHGELTKKEIKKARTKKYRKGRIDRFRKKGGTIKRRSNKKLVFKDYPEFTPNLTPREIFKLGSFGGTYWRPIYSGILNKSLKNVHKKYPKSWWAGIPEDHISRPFEEYDTNINKYGVKVGTTLEFWESKDWIKKENPYGWVHWYCDFFNGRRSSDDERQVKRWLQLASPSGRFMRFLVTQIEKKGGKWDDESISPKIRQVLQHWGYKLTKEDYDKEIKRRNKKNE
tara:strand:- start:395 stop:1360 length:966 start_codon:yes stop_codon:yes gene_type:complete